MKRKTRLICLIGQLGNGGTERQLYLFLKHLDRGRFKPSVVVSSNPGGSRWEKQIREELDIPVKFLGDMPKAAKLAKFAWAVLKEKADVVFSWSFYTNAFCIACPGARFIGSLRGGIGPAKKQLSASNFKYSLKPDMFIVNSLQLCRELEKEGVERNRISVIYNILETAKPLSEDERRGLSLSARASMGIPGDAFVVAGVGKESPEKDIPFFLDVLAEAVRSNSRITGLMIGKFGTATEQAVSERNLSGKVFFAGEIEDVPAALCSADIFFLSSVSEGMPNSVIEALAAGCPVLSTDVGGVREIRELTGTPDLEILPGRKVSEFAGIIKDRAGNMPQANNIPNKTWKKLDFFSSENIMPLFYKVLEKPD